LRPWRDYAKAGGRGVMASHNMINWVPCLLVILGTGHPVRGLDINHTRLKPIEPRTQGSMEDKC
jgi:hypothetical protein